LLIQNYGVVVEYGYTYKKNIDNVAVVNTTIPIIVKNIKIKEITEK